MCTHSGTPSPGCPRTPPLLTSSQRRGSHPAQGDKAGPRLAGLSPPCSHLPPHIPTARAPRGVSHQAQIKKRK